MLDLSASTAMINFYSFLAMGLTGLILPFIMKLWNRGWIWASIILMVAVFFRMVLMTETRYKLLRKLIGLPYMQGAKEFPAETPSSQQEVEAQLKKMPVVELMIVGYVILMVVLWLMVFKPF